MSAPHSVTSQHFGIPFPTSVASFNAQAREFLTCAFRASGVLEAGNSVSAITSVQEFEGGGMGRKLVVTLDYATPGGAAPARIFIKFPREFGDPLRELFNPVMEPEVRFALLSRREDFPVHVARCYFADSDPASQCHILITECIGFGTGAIEPHRDKCKDYLLPEPLPYYTALAQALGRLSGSHKSGALGGDIDAKFPFSGMVTVPAIGFSRAELGARLDKLREFIGRYPQLFPASCRAAGFMDEFAAAMLACYDAQDAIRADLTGNPDVIALSHWNANIDNAWFWRDAGGALQVGLLDWGSVGQMNLAQAFFGMTCAAEVEFLQAHRDTLIHTLLAAYRDSGGPAVAVAGFRRHLILATSVLGMAWMLDAPALIEMQLGAVVADLRGRDDPRLVDNFLARAQLHLLTVFLCDNPPAAIQAALRALPGTATVRTDGALT